MTSYCSRLLSPLDQHGEELGKAILPPTVASMSPKTLRDGQGTYLPDHRSVRAVPSDGNRYSISLVASRALPTVLGKYSSSCMICTAETTFLLHTGLYIDQR